MKSDAKVMIGVVKKKLTCDRGKRLAVSTYLDLARWSFLASSFNIEVGGREKPHGPKLL